MHNRLTTIIIFVLTLLSGCGSVPHQINESKEIDSIRVTVYSQKDIYELNKKAELKITLEYIGEEKNISVSGIENLCQVDIFRDSEGEIFVNDELFTYENFTSIENTVELNDKINEKGNYIIVLTIRVRLDSHEEQVATLRYRIRIV